jgi:hypothetical protein
VREERNKLFVFYVIILSFMEVYIVKYKVVSINEWLYPDSEINEDASTGISLQAAKGTHAGFQVLCKGVAKDASIVWKLDGKFKELSDIWGLPEVYQLVAVPVEKNTGPIAFVVEEGELAEGYTTRPAPFEVYDAMKPLSENALTSDHVEAFYFYWKVPENASTGSFSGHVLFEIGNLQFSVAVDLEVCKAVVPEQGTLYVTNWFSLQNMATRHNIEMWSERHWEMIRLYGKIMRRARQTHFWVPINIVEISKSAEGRYAFDFTKVERLIKMYFNLGFTFIEGGHVGTRTQFNNSEFVLTADKNIKAVSPEGYAFLAQYLTAWNSFLSEHGWLDKIVQHVADEPVKNSAQEYRILSGIVRKFMPGVPLIDAIGSYELGGSVDIWVPTNNHYQENRDKFEALRELGDKLWFYTCCVPGGYYMNRLMDVPLLRSRYLHWGNYLYNLEGFLHWGFNHYEQAQDPFKQSCPVHVAGNSDRRLPAGDTHLVYPGTEGPWSSVRLEAMRAGAEDYELLKLLSLKNKKEADLLASSCLQSFNKANVDPKHFETVHRRLLELLSLEN